MANATSSPLYTAEGTLAEGPNGPNNIASFFLTNVNAMVQQAFANTYKIKYNIESTEYAELKKYFGGALSGVIGSKVTVPHVKLRIIQDWHLRNIILRVENPSRVLMIGGGYSSFKKLCKMVPTGNHTLVYDRRRPKTAARIDADYLKARADTARGIIAPVSTNLQFGLLNANVFNGPNIAIVDNLNQIQTAIYDQIIFVDTIYDYHLDDVISLNNRMHARKVITMHHTCCELAKSKNAFVPNQFYRTKFIRNKSNKTISMIHEDGSAGYIHNESTFMLWSQTRPVEMLSTVLLDAYTPSVRGYGAYQITFDNLSLFSDTLGLRNTDGLIVECLDVLALMQGKYKTFWCEKGKLEDSLNYMLAQEENNPRKLVNWIRSHMSKVVVGPKVLDEKWDLMGNEVTSIIYYILLYSSLIKQELGTVLQHIGEVIMNDGRAKTPFRQFITRIKTGFGKFLERIGYRGRMMLDIIRELQNSTSFDNKFQFKARALLLIGNPMNNKINSPIINNIWYLIKSGGFPDGIGGVPSAGYLKIKAEYEGIKHNALYLNNSAAKIVGLIDLLKLNTERVVNVASSPGGLNMELTGIVTNYVYSENEFPEYSNKELYTEKMSYKFMKSITEVEFLQDVTLYISDAGVRADFVVTNRKILFDNFETILRERPKCALIKFMNYVDAKMYKFNDDSYPVTMSKHFTDIINNYEITPHRTPYTHKLSAECYFLLKRRVMQLGNFDRKSKPSRYLDPLEKSKLKLFEELNRLYAKYRADWANFYYFYEVKKFELIKNESICHDGKVKKKPFYKSIHPTWFRYARVSSIQNPEEPYKRKYVSHKPTKYIRSFHNATNIQYFEPIQVTWEPAKAVIKVVSFRSVKSKGVTMANIWSETDKSVRTYYTDLVYEKFNKKIDNYFYNLKEKFPVAYFERQAGVNQTIGDRVVGFNKYFRTLEYIERPAKNSKLASNMYIPEYDVLVHDPYLNMLVSIIYYNKKHIVEYDYKTAPKLKKEDVSSDLKQSILLKHGSKFKVVELSKAVKNKEKRIRQKNKKKTISSDDSDNTSTKSSDSDDDDNNDDKSVISTASSLVEISLFDNNENDDNVEEMILDEAIKFAEKSVMKEEVVKLPPTEASYVPEGMELPSAPPMDRDEIKVSDGKTEAPAHNFVSSVPGVSMVSTAIEKTPKKFKEPTIEPKSKKNSVVDVTDTSRHKDEVEIKRGPVIKPTNRRDPKANGDLVQTKKVIRKAVNPMKEEYEVDHDYKFEPKVDKTVKQFLKDKDNLSFKDVPADGWCVYYAIAGICHNMIERYPDVQYAYENKFKLNSKETVPAAMLPKVCEYFGVSFVILNSNGAVIRSTMFDSQGVLCAFDREGNGHCGVIVTNNGKKTPLLGGYVYPHRFVRTAIDLPVRDDTNRAVTTGPFGTDINDVNVERFIAFKKVAKTICVEQYKKYVNDIKFVKASLPWMFYVGSPGTGKSSALRAYILPHLLKCKRLAMKSSEIFVISTVASNRSQINEELRVDADMTGSPDDLIPIKTHHAIYANYLDEAKEGFKTKDARIVCWDEGFRLSFTEYVVAHQVFPSAIFIVFGDPDQNSATPEEYVKNHAIANITTLEDIFGKQFLTTPSAAVTVNKVSRRFGPMVPALVQTFHPEIKFYVDSFRPMQIEFNPKKLVYKPGTKIKIALEGETIRNGAFDGQSVNSAQGMSVNNEVLMIDNNSVANLSRFPQACNVALTRAKDKMIILGPDREIKKFRAKVNVAMTSYGGLRVGNLKRVAVIDPDFDAELARETAMMGYPLPEGPSEFKVERKINYPFTASVKDFSLPLFNSFATENPYSVDNSREAMSYGPDYEYPMKIIRAHYKQYEHDMVRIGHSFSGKQHFSASTVQEIATFMGRYEIALKRQKYQAKMLKGMDIWNLGENAKEVFFDSMIDKKLFEKNLDRKIFDDILLKTWNDFAVVAKFDKADAEMTMRGFRAIMRGHLKKQIKSKGFEKAYANDMGQPISAAEKAINLIFSCLFRFMSIMIKASLKSNIKVADGMSDREVWEFVKQFEPEKVFMGDYPKYDATQTKNSHIVEAATWLLVCPDKELLKFYLDASRGRPIYTANFIAQSAAQRDSGQVDTMCGNWLTNMIHMSFMLGKGAQIVYAVFKGDDSGVGLANSSFYLYGGFYDLFFPEPIKVILHEEVLEFCNYLFNKEAYVYNPHIFMMKLQNKTYSEVTKKKENWTEYQTAMKDMLNSYLEHPEQAEILCSKWTGNSTIYYNVFFQQLQAFALLGFNHVDRKNKNVLQLHDIQVRDYGGSREGLKKQTEPLEMQAVTFKSSTKVFTSNEMDIKSKYNEAMMDGFKAIGIRFEQCGYNTTNPLYVCTASRDGYSYTGEPRNDKLSAERSALFGFIKTIGNTNLGPVAISKVREDHPCSKAVNAMIDSENKCVAYISPELDGHLTLSVERPNEEEASMKLISSCKSLTELRAKINNYVSQFQPIEYPIMKLKTKTERLLAFERIAWYYIIKKAASEKCIISTRDALMIHDCTKWDQFVDFRKLLATAAGVDSWLRDLTAEGIEPNPGPPKQNKGNKKQQYRPKKGKQEIKQVEKKVEAKVEKKFEKKMKQLKNEKTVKRIVNKNGKIRPHYSSFKNGKMATAEQIALTIACPEDTMPIRLHHASAANTALNKLRLTSSAKFCLDDDKQIVKGQWAAFIFRDMLRSAIVYTPNSALWTYDCIFMFDYAANTATQPSSTVPLTIGSDDLVTFTPKIKYYQAVGANNIHGNFLFTGKPSDTESQFVWLGKNDVMNAIITGYSGTASLRFKTILWANGRWSEKEVYAIAANGTVGLKSNDDGPGYYSWNFTVVSGTGTATVAVQISGNEDVWAHKSTPYVGENLFAISGYRQNAKSIRVTNSTPEFSNDAFMAAVQAAKGQFWTSYTNVAYDGTNTMSKISETKTSTGITNGKKGYTGYVKPNEISDFIYKTGINMTDVTVQACSFLLDANSDFIAVAFRSANPDKMNLEYNIVEHNEYKTDDQWREVEPSLLREDATREALEMIRFAPQHAENPNHWTEFWNGIKSVASKVMKGAATYGPAILKFAEKAMVV